MKNGYNPNPVNNLFRDAVTGRLSRRQVIQRGTALGLSSALMGTILRAESIGAQATPSAEQPQGWSMPDAATLQEELQLNTDIAGTQMNVVLGADNPGTWMDELIIARFNEITGAEAVLVKGAESATDRLSFYLQTMAAQSSEIDAAMIDVIWPGIMAAHSVDLSDVIGDYDYFPRIVENNTVDDMLVGIPWFTDAGVFYFRQDLLEKYGFEAEPQTWDELEEQAQTIMEGEIGANPAFTGFVWQGNAYEGLTCNALEWQFSQDGGRIIEPDGSVTVNNPEAIAAFERAAGWVGGISPDAVTGYMEQDARGVFQGGNAAFMRNWPYAYALGKESKIADDFAVTTFPKYGETEGAGVLGGYNLAISAYSENPEGALAFANFATSPDAQVIQASKASLPAVLNDVYDDPAVTKALPFASELRDAVTQAKPRPVTPVYPQVSEAIYNNVFAVLQGDMSPDEAATKMNEEIQSALETF